MNYAVIMAGGTGKRLWPLSRKSRPKQVLKLIDGETLLGKCYKRLVPLFDPKNILVLTNSRYVDLVRQELVEIPDGNIIAEPAVRDTTGAIGLAATVLSNRDPDATMAVVTADHIIEPAEVFQQIMGDAVTFINANPETLVTFGVQPTFPSTQLGYIKCIEPIDFQGCQNQIYRVEAFKEKPDSATADEYIKNGQYFWNSGMFVWKAGNILDHLRKFLPESAEPLDKIRDGWGTDDRQKILDEWFVRIPKISIDFAVMEKAPKVHALKLTCKWYDMGGFTALADIIESDSSNNVVVAGLSELLDCKNSIVVTEDQGHLIAGIGLDNIIVAHSPDATLICDIKHAQRLKELVETLEKNGREHFL